MSAPEGHCQFCVRKFVLTRDGRIPAHRDPPFVGMRCPGSGQPPAEA